MCICAIKSHITAWYGQESSVQWHCTRSILGFESSLLLLLFWIFSVCMQDHKLYYFSKYFVSVNINWYFSRSFWVQLKRTQCLYTVNMKKLNGCKVARNLVWRWQFDAESKMACTRHYVALWPTSSKNHRARCDYFVEKSFGMIP